MVKINDLKQDRANKLALMQKIVDIEMTENRGKTVTETRMFNELEREIRDIDERLDDAIKQDEINKRNPGTKVSTSGTSFRDWMNRSITGDTKGSYKIEVRANPFLTSTDTGIINKVIDNVDVLYSPAEELLKSLGVKFYTNVTGNLVLPNMSEDTATFANETTDASSADMQTECNTLSALRCTHTQTVTKELLAQTSGNVLETVQKALYNGIWNAVAEKFFNELDADAATQLCSNNNSVVTFSHIVNLEASTGGYDLARPAYVMKPQTKAYLKKITKLANAQNSVWEADKVNEYSAYASPFVNDERIYFGDWSKTAVASFGDGIEIIIDPFTQASKGEIVFTAVGMFDCGVINKRAFSILADASTF